MTPEEKLKLLETWLARYRALDAAMDQLIDAGLDPECPLHDAAFRVFDEYTRLVGEKVGDRGEWLGWWLYDNDQGRKKFSAWKGEKKLPGKTLRQLLAIIEA